MSPVKRPSEPSDSGQDRTSLSKSPETPADALWQTPSGGAVPAAAHQTNPFGFVEPQMRTTFKEKSLRIFSMASLAFLGLALVGYTVVLYGWMANISALRHPFEFTTASGVPIIQTIGFPTAFWFTLLILSSLPTVLDVANKLLRWLSRLGVGLTMLIGLTLWLEHILGADWNTRIEIYSLGGSGGTLSLPGNMPVDVSFMLWALSATALLLDRFGWSRPLLVQIVCLLFSVPSLVLISAAGLGLSDSLDHFCAETGCVRFFIYNYMEFAFISLALLTARPTVGLIGVLSLDSIGARLFRMMCLGLVGLLPLACLMSYLIRLEIISLPIAVVLSLVSIGLMMGLVIYFGAKRLDKIDFEKHLTEKSLKELSDKQAATSYKMVCLECGKDFDEGWVNCPYDGTALSRVVDKLSQGSIFADKYEIDKPLGSGGMSTVYKANHIYLDKPVAIKVLNQNLASDPIAVRRFQIEARAAHDLNHPNLLAVHDFGVSLDGQAYIVMDFLKGQSLAEKIQAEGKLDIITAIPIFIQVASGLAFAHEKGVLHRDIKPSNVMLVSDANGKTVSKIVDFGLAKTYDEKAMKLTQTGEIFGSPIYMSPEQCQGEELDARSDLYALGVLMYETLAGKVPFMGRNAFETFRAKLSEDVPPFDAALNIPAWLSATVITLLDRNVEKRPPNAGLVVARLQSYFKAP
jgi:tRNA A-37 threonylcarbamoyl transferase component Bud32